MVFQAFRETGFWSPGSRELYALETDDQAVVRAILRLYLRQTETEVSDRETHWLNGVGLNVPDGHVMANIAEFILAADLLGFEDRDFEFVRVSHELAREYLSQGYSPEKHRKLEGAKLADARARLYKYAEQLATYAPEEDARVAG